MNESSAFSNSAALELAILNELVLRPPEGVNTQIHPNDQMFKGNMTHYVNVGNSALHCIRLALLSADCSEVMKILDLPCGYGRVLRVLRAAFPKASITASDIVEEAVEFCANRLGAIPMISERQPEDLEIDDRFDLIWCGSLLTHLEEERYRGFLSLFANVLADDGVVVFTVHGAWVAERLRKGLRTLPIGPDEIQVLLEEYDRIGFSYANYPHRSGYGISMSRPSWVCSALASLPTLRLVSYMERGWDNHQDVVACKRVTQ